MLEKELENFWRVNGLGEYPVDAKLSVASRVKLWAAGTHADIGYAAAHPNFDGKARWMHTYVPLRHCCRAIFPLNAQHAINHAA